ncbi:MAG: class I SAM-dependent methyltransferase [Deltaproteobacteria bacterium]|nr:class I SAM-dependent methyltransferase [Deltaproteobacteria bacterium]
MANKMEQFLKKGMQGVGQIVEKAIGKAAAAKASVATGAGIAAPVLETQLGIPKVKELLTLATDRLVPSLLPNLAGRAVVEIADGVGKFAPMLKEKGAKVVASLEIGLGAPVGSSDVTRQVYVVRGSLRRLPFADHFFEFGFANMATPQQGDFLRAIKEIARVLAPGGNLLVTDYHPFGAFAKRGGARIKPAESTLKGMGDYFKIARLVGLHVQDIRETFIDETTRAAFTTPEEKTAYRALKESPLMICLVLQKGAAHGV